MSLEGSPPEIEDDDLPVEAMYNRELRQECVGKGCGRSYNDWKKARGRADSPSDVDSGFRGNERIRETSGVGCQDERGKVDYLRYSPRMARGPEESYQHVKDNRSYNNYKPAREEFGWRRTSHRNEGEMLSRLGADLESANCYVKPRHKTNDYYGVEDGYYGLLNKYHDYRYYHLPPPPPPPAPPVAVPTPTRCECNKNRKQDKQRNRQIIDLYRIVFLQNQQLSLVQNQLKTLIEIVNRLDKGKEKRTFNLSVIESNQNEKVSVGLMTSFVENSTKQKEKRKQRKLSKRTNSSSSSSSSSSSDEDECESTDDDTDHELIPDQVRTTKKQKSRSSKRKELMDRDNSLTLNGVEIAPAPDNIPSPQSSFHLEIQDYKSSSSDSESSNSSEESEQNGKVGWTFYDNVVGKVNDILKTEDEQHSTDDDDSDSQIRNATLDQIRKLGISFVEQENTIQKRVTFENGDYRNEMPSHQRLRADTDTSMKMNALASKYLNSERLQQAFEVRDMTLGQATHQIQSNGTTNLSFATMKYMEKYHILPKPKVDSVEKSKKKSKKTKKSDEIIQKKKKSIGLGGGQCNKILDVTAIRQQPKLLPKKI